VPYQVCDGSDIVPRAEFTLSLVPLLPDSLQTEAAAEVLTRRLVVTLCEPSQPVAHHQQAADLQSAGLKQREIATRLGLAQSTVERALRIHRQLSEQDLPEPYFRLTNVPVASHRLRRHRHVSYRFEPLAGYPQ